MQTIDRRMTAAHPRLVFLRPSVHNILIWPAVCIVAGLLLWGLIHSKLDSDHEVMEQAALKQATSLSYAYAEQLSRTIAQIDQITRNVKYSWEANHGLLRLDEQQMQGLYPRGDLLYVTIFGRTGTIVSSSMPFDRHQNYAALPFFKAHQISEEDEFLISEPRDVSQIKPTLIYFSRRINSRDGSFDGVVQVAVEPRFLASFYDESIFGKSDFLSVRTTNGTLLVSKMGVDIRSLERVFRTPPVFATPGGALSFPHDTFVDDQARVIAWQTLPNYPLRSLVGLSHQDIFASLAIRAVDYHRIGLAGSGLLALFAVLGMLATARLAWREHQAEEIKATYRLVIEEGGESFYMLQALYDSQRQPYDFVVQDCNERGAISAGLSKDALIGQSVSLLTPADFWVPMVNACIRALHRGLHEDEYSTPLNGQPFWTYRRLVRSGDGVAATLRDITDQKTHEAALARLANVDALTSLPNRYWLTGFLPLALQRAQEEGRMLALLFLDLDNFKNINDTLGHAAGDELLQAVALRLRSVVRAIDSVVRLGGDEFTIVLEQVDHQNTVAVLSEAIVKALVAPFVLLGGSLHLVHASIGISVYPADGDTAAVLLKNADIAMYAAKARGKANYQFFQPHFSENLVNRLNLEHALRSAIVNDEFILHFQPRVAAHTGQLLSLEALVRWIHPQRGMVPPLEFIGVAEDTGLIVGLGELVIAKTCAQLAQWKVQGLPLVPVSINASFRQFGQAGEGDLKEILTTHMERYAIDPALIEIELTESCMMGEQNVIRATLAGLQTLGITLLVDDFGTGYSSLSQLQQLDFDVLKVDRAFTSALGKSTEGEVFFRAIISMAHALGMQVVAEGVETIDQLQHLQRLGCDEIQGYYISRPLPAIAIPELLHRRFLLPTVCASLPMIAHDG